MTPTKNCQECGAVTRKRKNESRAMWARRKYCSRACFSRARASQPIIDRVLTRCVQAPSGCWEFTGSTSQGYGRLGMRAGQGKSWLSTHRVTYEFFIHEIPAGLVLDHLCRNRKCANPWHLDPVTDRVNMLRGESPFAIRAKRSSCHLGHEFTTENTYVDARGGRVCRACRREYARVGRLRRSGREVTA